MKDFGAIMRGHAHGILEQVFNAEWIELDATAQKLVAQDFLEASEGGMTARQYHLNIGRGNLRSYADVMIVRERRGWDGPTAVFRHPFKRPAPRPA
jgi:hypothetical protein